jgi:hypothetical protein
VECIEKRDGGKGIVTKRWIVRLCLAVILLTLPLGAFSFIQVPKTQAADTVIPKYGCPATLDGSPIGGGVGYLNITYPSQADYVVSTPAQLKSALAAATSGQIVYVADGATIVMNDDALMYGDMRPPFYGSLTGFYVKPGVTLAGGRGRSGVTPGVIRLASGFHSSAEYNLIGAGKGSRVTGLVVTGPMQAIDGTCNWIGIEATTNAEVDNCEVYGFGYVGIQGGYQCTGAWIHHNYVHHCRQQGYGYLVAVTAMDVYHTASALVEGNRFDYGRHCISGSRGRTSYIFRYNEIGPNFYEPTVDVHGQQDAYPNYAGKDGSEYIYPAGDRIEVYNNTSRCTTEVFVNVRGKPYSGGFISIHNNWSYLPSGWTWVHEPDCGGSYTARAIAECMTCLPEDYVAPSGGAFVRMEQHDNWWGTTAPPSTSYSTSAVSQAPATPVAPEGPVSGLTGTEYTYHVKTTDPDGDTLTYTIDWGDGTTHTTGSRTSGTLVSPSHNWTQAGTYAIRVRATDSKGNVSAWSPSLSVTIAAVNQPPLTPAAPEGTVSAQAGTAYTCSVKTTDPDGDNIAYTIDWGDGTSSTTGQLNSGVIGSASHTWTQAGTYPVKVRATDSNGIVSAWSPSLSVTIAAVNQPPLTPAAPEGTVSAQAGTAYTCSVKTTDPDGDNIAYTIDWGDGTSSTNGQLNSGVIGSASHTWTQAGTYPVKVRATDSNGIVSAWSPSLSVVTATANQTPLIPGGPGGTMSGAPARALQEQEISAATDASANPLPVSSDTGDTLVVPAHRSGFVWWLLITSVVLSAVVLLVRAIVRTAVPEAPGGQDHNNPLHMHML